MYSRLLCLLLSLQEAIVYHGSVQHHYWLLPSRAFCLNHGWLELKHPPYIAHICWTLSHLSSPRVIATNGVPVPDHLTLFLIMPKKFAQNIPPPSPSPPNYISNCRLTTLHFHFHQKQKHCSLTTLWTA
jgi:hypothetical protein